MGIFVSQRGGRRIPSNNGDSPAGVTPARSCGKKGLSSVTASITKVYWFTFLMLIFKTWNIISNRPIPFNQAKEFNDYKFYANWSFWIP